MDSVSQREDVGCGVWVESVVDCAIGFSATSELYFSYAILTTGVVVLTLYFYQYTRMMRGGPTI